jgi:quercetin dioxygenase-like cupin family protein
MSYTIKNLREIEDMAPRFGNDAVQEARFARRPLDAENTGLAYHVVKPGQRNRPHRHDDAEEIYVVIGGTGRAVLDGETVELKTMDAIRVAPAVTRAFEGGPDGLELLAFGPHHEGDGELLDEDPWPDN